MAEFEYAGTVSYGTMRTQDLIPDFVDMLEKLYTQEQMDEFWKNQPTLEKLCPEGSGFAADSDPLWDSDEVAFFLNETLFDVLNECAPEGYRFGAHEGDGSDYGFWAVETEEDPEEGQDEPNQTQLWAALRGKMTLALICDLLQQDVEAEPNLPEPEILQAKRLLETVQDILQKRGV